MKVLDAIDVAQAAQAKPLLISLEPVSKRGRVRAKVKTNSADKVDDRLSRGSQANAADPSSNEHSPENQTPLSPSPSEISSASAVTASTQSFQVMQRPPSANGNSLSNSENRNSSTSAGNEQKIDANVELLKPGALPGETVYVRVTVNHVKRIRGTIIVTLYRQGRVDMHPPIPISTRGKTKHEYEDIYPRSKTGLGGLHFSTGSPSSQFRMDLTQSFTPMIVNPQTLTADVKASIRVPEDVFPSIDNVPGNMILFKYYVEVVIDVCGKLGESRILPRMNMTSNPANYASDRYHYDNLNPLTTSTNERVIDTDQMRRTKSVVHCHFELTVGSRDSSKTSRKWPQEPRAEDFKHPSNDIENYPAQTNGWSHDEYYSDGVNGYNEYDDHDYQYDEYWQNYYAAPDPSSQQTTAEQLFPPPRRQSEDGLDEKARLRRQEELLLPSRPPVNDEAGPSNRDMDNPSAPFVFDLHRLPGERGHDFEGAPVQDSSAFTIPSNRSVDTVVRAPATPGGPPPIFESHHHSSAPQEDKQELERRRLMELTSAPPIDGAPASSSGLHPPDVAPSAPVLAEDDEYNVYTLNHDHQTGDNLPEYRR